MTARFIEVDYLFYSNLLNELLRNCACLYVTTQKSSPTGGGVERRRLIEFLTVRRIISTNDVGKGKI